MKYDEIIDSTDTAFMRMMQFLWCEE